MEDLAGRLAIVTGASSGIGEGIARALAAAGMTVLAVARRGDRLDRLVAAIAQAGGRAEAAVADVSDEAAVRAVFAGADDRHGAPFLLVNNAGVGQATPLEQVTLAAWNRIMAVNLTGAFLCAREAFVRMKAAGGGRIVSIGSISARVPRDEAIAYNASKYALEGMTRSLAIEGRAHLVTATCIHPGATRSDFAPGRTDRLEGDCLLPEHIGQLVVYAARLPRDCALLDATVIPVRVPFLARG
ncbi:MAG: SDR family oxidoreductase [Rhodobacteraceae bacterium]|jgi:NAD(P)-dependent dehydrogenase (short-subunit alcohol dehydrogenase family)|nr:SDR family oxidoreductase [Paracoccaceae bacterium]